MNKPFLVLALCLTFAQIKTTAQSSAIAQPVSLSSFPRAAKIKIAGDATGYANGIKIKSAIVKVDTTIRVSPITAYWSIEMEEITGSSLPEIAGGTNSFWITDKNGKEVKIKEKFLKKIGASMESNMVNFTAKIPYCLKTDLKSSYTVRFRWESADKKKMIDIVSTK